MIGLTAGVDRLVTVISIDKIAFDKKAASPITGMFSQFHFDLKINACPKEPSKLRGSVGNWSGASMNLQLKVQLEKQKLLESQVCV